MKTLRAVGAVLVALVLIVWLGDLPNRCRASQSHQRGQAAYLNNEWSAALDRLREAARFRPTDLDYRRDYDTLQEKWVRYQQGLADGEAPEETQARLDGEPAAVAKALMEPHATHYRNFARKTLEQVQTRLAAAAAGANELAAQKKFTEAAAVLEKLRPQEKYFPQLSERLEAVRRAEVRDAFARTEFALATNDFSTAQQALDGVRRHAALLPDEFERAECQLRQRESFQQLADAVAASQRGEFASALSQLDVAEKRVKELGALAWFNRAMETQLAGEPPERQAALRLDSRLALARQAVRRAIVQHGAARLAVALGRRDEPAAQAALEELARLTGRNFSLRADDLLRERDLDAFLSALVALDLRPATEAERMNRADLIMVETLRENFSAPERVTQFLARGYRDWAEQTSRDGRPALALYLARRAGDAGEGMSPGWDGSNREKLAQNFRTTIRWVSPKSAAGSAPPDDPWWEILRRTIARANQSWLSMETGAGEEGRSLLLRADLQLPAEEHKQNQFIWAVRYQSGTQNTRNPAYDQLAAELRNAQYALDQARAVAAQTRSQAQYYANTGLVGAVAAAATTGYSDGGVQGAANRVNQLSGQLANTPAYLSSPDYAVESIPVTVHTVNHAAALELKVFDGTGTLGRARWDANLRYATREWPGSSRANVAARPAALFDARGATDWLRRDLGAKIEAQSYAVLQLLATAFGKSARQKFAAAGPLDQAEAAWSQVELWRTADVELDDFSRREEAVRRALGLPLVQAGTPVGVSGRRPWQNSLSQAFVPIAGTSVLFSVWETRRQDFEAFVSETKHDAVTHAGTFSIGSTGWVQGQSNWKSPGFAQEPAHPVTCVSYMDAKAFCAWLTQKERAAGVIGPQDRYRLPTDTEWSVAAGLSAEPAGSPMQKRRATPGFAWGTEWPPRLGAGNYAGFEARELPGWPNWQVLEEYGDGYAGTAPVGMFSANANGLHDLDGNVQEWCEDFLEPGDTKHVTRGSCFSYSAREHFLLSERTSLEPHARFTVVGFRIVLEPAGRTL